MMLKSYAHRHSHLHTFILIKIVYTHTYTPDKSEHKHEHRLHIYIPIPFIYLFTLVYLFVFLGIETPSNTFRPPANNIHTLSRSPSLSMFDNLNSATWIIFITRAHCFRKKQRTKLEAKKNDTKNGWALAQPLANAQRDLQIIIYTLRYSTNILCCCSISRSVNSKDYFTIESTLALI